MLWLFWPPSPCRGCPAARLVVIITSNNRNNIHRQPRYTAAGLVPHSGEFTSLGTIYKTVVINNDRKKYRYVCAQNLSNLNGSKRRILNRQEVKEQHNFRRPPSHMTEFCRVSCFILVIHFYTSIALSGSTTRTS